MDHPSRNNLPATAERRLPQNAMSCSSCDFGESSSNASLRDQISGDVLKMDPDRPLSYRASLAGTRPEDFQQAPSNSPVHEGVGADLIGGQVNWGPLSIQNSGSDASPVNGNSNARFSEINESQLQCVGADACPSLYKSSTVDTRITSASISSDDVGNSSERSSYHVGNDGTGSSPRSWGPSCKRKAPEVTSQPCSNENSGLFPRAKNTVLGTAHHNASSSLNISVQAVRSQTRNSLIVGSSEQVNTVHEVGMGGTPDAIPPSVAGSVENFNNDFGSRFDVEHQELIESDSPSGGNSIRCPNVQSSHPSSQHKPNDSSDFRRATLLPTDSSSSSNHLRPGPSLNRNAPFTWNGNFNSRTNSSPNSPGHPRDRGAGLRREANLRGNTRNNLEQLMFVPATETRNLVQVPTPASMSSGNSSSSVSVASSGQTSSSSRLSGGTQYPLSLPDFARTPFPSTESIEASRFSPHQLDGSSPDEREMPSLDSVHPQPSSRHALSREVEGVDVNVRSALAAEIRERHRLVSEIRHVLHTMRRGENLQAEDYMLFDTFINGAGILHDRHRDLRLDVHDMSYEDLLELEDQMGNVNTGLKEETIMKLLIQRHHSSVTIEDPSKIEPCCICQEDYIAGDSIGTLNCGHDFHTNCIKQWLMQKNVCPICKTMALRT
ncbi:hypothetical protein DCAR_0624158 [Daucus carota subsp. sativus]|uniref:RING-type E3 ubiquitin transferase n=1 Tax=Daucus carota subsp. sativus TaxID=79200 RepID=A0AAF1B692_DAUCS|nr:PREDICTED: E3 ubiquitin-protein ligase MBR2-like isoform X1 [Daucus carota subsp. sativus]XP_017256145.1 PREDICTED: E3 ubiquitin-protein ligase MBR2-like isoform X1 [Daucus carota subsp. sativus]WOH04746.1 hypothetical protein DCAR_0624158 [Daucus carota subsp. sativus]